MKQANGFLLLEFLTTLLLISLFTFIIAQYQVMTIVWSQEAERHNEVVNGLQAHAVALQLDPHCIEKKKYKKMIVETDVHPAPYARTTSVYMIPSRIRESFKIAIARATFASASKKSRTISCSFGVCI